MNKPPAPAALQRLFPDMMDISPPVQGKLDWTCSVCTPHGTYQLVGIAGFAPEVWFVDESREPDSTLSANRQAWMLSVERALCTNSLDENKIH